MDYGKESFEKRKQDRESRKKQKRTQVKEIKFRPGTDIGDYQVKLRNLIRFLEAGDKVKVTMRYRGREMAHQDLGYDTIRRAIAELDHIGTPDNEPRLVGRNIIVMMSPLPVNKRKLKYNVSEPPPPEEEQGVDTAEDDGSADSAEQSTSQE